MRAYMNIVNQVVHPDDITTVDGEQYVNIHGLIELVMVSGQSDSFKTECLKIYETGDALALMEFICKQASRNNPDTI